MFFRFRSLVASSLLFAAACSAPNPGGDQDDPGQGLPVPLNDQNATSLGVSIMSSDANGAPRLIRAIVPRAVVAGTAPEAAARDHINALASLWVGQARPTT